MSYYTLVEFQFADEAPPFAEVEACARAQFDPEQYAVDDIVEAFRRGWNEGKTELNRFECADIEAFMCRVSKKFPEQRMCARGSGEEWRDFWLREFEGGKIAFSAGPFLEGKKPAFFRFFFGDPKA